MTISLHLSQLRRWRSFQSSGRRHKQRGTTHSDLLAREAAVDRSTIYRSHPELIERFRNTNSGRQKKKDLSLNTEYRELIEQAQNLVSQLANINYRKKLEMELLAIKNQELDKVVSELRRQIASYQEGNQLVLKVIRGQDSPKEFRSSTVNADRIAAVCISIVSLHASRSLHIRCHTS